MLGYREAEKLAQSRLDEIMSIAASCPPVCLVREHTISKPYGWVFFYQSRAFVETGDKDARVAGNYPFLVDRFTGRIVPLGPFWKRDLAEHEAELAPEQLATAPELPPFKDAT